MHQLHLERWLWNTIANPSHVCQMTVQPQLEYDDADDADADDDDDDGNGIPKS